VARRVAAGDADTVVDIRPDDTTSLMATTAAMRTALAGIVGNVRAANTLAQEASGITGRGGAIAAQVVDMMGTINASSRKIVDIIAAIDGIAFQTNIH
jgi:methyl-accepting chemotaxis protein